MKFLFLLALIGLTACGRKDNCKNKEEIILECRAVNQPNYGYTYANEMCNRTYKSDRCY